MIDVEPVFATPMCMSGGADGADLQWGMTAGMAGHTVIHWSFEGARTRAPIEEVVRLSHDQLVLADPFLERANLTLGRRLNPGKPWMMNLLRRNYYQVKDSSSLYAVSSIKNGLVQGGTSWAVQMFIDQEGGPCAAYVFDQITNQWYTWDNGWCPIDQPPVPSGVWAGIGSRELLPAGKEAIRSLLGYVKPS